MTPLYASANPEAARLAKELARFAPTSLPLLLEGETGTGKSFLARRIHRRSRPGQPLVVVDCAAIPETLFPAELFGHTAGAFTDATRSRPGFLQQVREGTLVLDRVDALSPASQAALLRVLEEGQYVPLGATQARSCRARVLALVGPDLLGKMERGEFRRDLYHRLAGWHAVLLPLRQRREDILPTARRWLARKDPALHLTREAEELLLHYHWPGNFRELVAVLERALVVQRGSEVGVEALDFAQWRWEELVPHLGPIPLAQAMRVYALFVLAREKGNVSRAARTLGISRRTLIRWRRPS
ncbi:MAG: sigma 54-interacting transcriptional regulator [Thermoanaerobaculum sp.]|nr:sigma 54-interacting transcriptional regulator [Thermoanaerobaculum sp.]MDW7966678.1 sigma 54-interacting transcriptional regulator [Thermoanaerobaculum sp.]